jgi:hypothetical protein
MCKQIVFYHMDLLNWRVGFSEHPPYLLAKVKCDLVLEEVYWIDFQN